MVVPVSRRRGFARASILVALLGPVAWAGCFEPVGPPEVYVEPPAGDEVFQVDIRVLEEGDGARPVPDAVVHVLSGDSTLRTTTSDGDGVARFWIGESPASQRFGVAAFADGWTEERIDGAFGTNGSAKGVIHVALPLYRSELTFNETYLWQGPATVQMVGDRTAVSERLGFADDQALEHAYSRRIDTVTVRIEWENTPTEHADFGVFIRGNGDGGEEATTVRADQDQGVLHQGAASEEVTVDRAGLIAVVDSRSPEAFYGIETKEQVVAPQGIEVDVQIRATFRTPVIEVAEGAMLDPLVVLLGALASVAAVRRRHTG